MILSRRIVRLRRYIKKVAGRSPGELAREAAKRARTAFKLERRFGRGRAFAPYALSFWPTRRCNMRCEMCWLAQATRDEGEGYLRAGEELTLAELQAVVDDCARWRPRVGITGGEPFLRRDVLDFIAHIKKRGLRAGVNTNGAFLAGDAARLVEVELDSIMVSVDGPPEIHDRIRGSSGAFARAREGIEAVIRERRRRGAAKPYIKVTCTVSDANVAALAEIPALFADLPLDEFTFQHLWFTDQVTADIQRQLFRELFGEDTSYLQGFVVEKQPPLAVDVLREQTREITARDWPFDVNFYPTLGDDEVALFYESRQYNFRPACFSRWLRLDIMPWGGVTPCLGLEVGNVRERPLREIWNGPRMRRFRAELASRGLFPGCSRCCGLFSD